MEPSLLCICDDYSKINLCAYGRREEGWELSPKRDIMIDWLSVVRVMVQITLPKHTQQKFLEALSLGFKKKKYEKHDFCSVLNWKGPGKYPRGYSGLVLWAHLQPQSHMASLAGITARCLPPAAQPQAQPGGTSLAKFMPPAARAPTQILAHPAIRLPHPATASKSGPLLGQEERRTFPGAKMGIVLLLMDFFII